MPKTHTDRVTIPVGDVELDGILSRPDGATGLVVFVHGSGSSRHSPRNRFVADALQEQGFATLLFDLLTTDEERTDQINGRLRFDIELLARRVRATVGWVKARSELTHLPIGLFGASTGAAAAIVAAADCPDDVRCVVSRGGRPDLAGSALDRLQARTLLIVGEADTKVIELNRHALARMHLAELEIVPQATHLFEEEGALEQVVDLASTFFRLYLQTLQPV